MKIRWFLMWVWVAAGAGLVLWSEEYEKDLKLASIRLMTLSEWQGTQNEPLGAGRTPRTVFSPALPDSLLGVNSPSGFKVDSLRWHYLQTAYADKPSFLVAFQIQALVGYLLQGQRTGHPAHPLPWTVVVPPEHLPVWRQYLRNSSVLTLLESQADYL